MLHNNLFSLIKSAIKEADRGLFFWNDYESQALNIIEKLELQGYIITPKIPNDKMIENGRKCINYGITDPKELVKEIYMSMLNDI